MRSLRFGIASMLTLLVACGGTVAPDDTRTPPGSSSPSAPRPGGEASPAPDPSRSPSPRPACTPTTAQNPATLDSCDVAPASLVVEPYAVRWRTGAKPWSAGAQGWVDMRYRNDSDARDIEYPGVAFSSNDPRITTEDWTAPRPNGEVSPDFYALSRCQVDDRSHGFVVAQDVPSGTHVRFTIAPGVATGDGINDCGGALRPVFYDVVVP